MKSAWVWVLMGCLGCDHATSSPPDAAAPRVDIVETNGSRLKLEWWQSADGARQLRGVYDSQRAEECSFRPFGDGTLYCAPLSTGGRAYADAACTQLRAVTDAAVPPKYVVETIPGSSCTGHGTIMRLYAVGAAATETSVYQLTNGACTGPRSGLRIYNIDHEVSPSGLVGGVLDRGTSTASVVETAIKADDGLIIPHELYGTASSAACRPLQSPHLQMFQCLPVDDGYASVTTNFANPTCTVPAAGVSAGCATPAVATSLTTSTCDVQPRYLVGAPLSSIYDPTGGCHAVAPSPTSHYFAVGESVRMPGLGRAHDADPTHRLRTSYLTTRDGLYQHDHLFDALLGIECSMVPDSAGVGRCAPLDVVSVSAAFSDPTCTVPQAAILLPQDPACAGVPPRTGPKYNLRSVFGPDGPLSIIGIDAVDPAPRALYVMNGATCTRFDGYAVGAPVSVDTFVSASAVIEP